jgi:molybdenum cofactor synthesis domain-containing protein
VLDADQAATTGAKPATDHHGESLVAVGEVLAALLAGREPLTPVAVALHEALGSVLAEPLLAPDDLPPFACSAMDGFAVRSADVAAAPVELDVVAAPMAGDAPAAAIGEGEAVRVMTGAPVPPGADAVVMIEQTSAGSAPDCVRIERSVPPGLFVRPAGDDVRAGELVFEPGQLLGPAHLGIAAALGRSRLVVHPRPRVGVLSTGDELSSGPGPLRPGAIRDSNSVTLAAALSASGFVPVPLGAVGDDAAAVAAAVEEATRRCDAVITTGGVSVGDRDVVKPALERIEGSLVRSFRIAVKPGKPFVFAELPGGTPVFALPGNPVSSTVAFELLVRPVLRRLAGHPSLYRPAVRAVAEEDLRREPDGRLHLLRARLRCGPDGSLLVRSAGGQGSHQLRAMAEADALAVLPDGSGASAGSEVDVVLLDAGEPVGDPPAAIAATGNRTGTS